MSDVFCKKITVILKFEFSISKDELEFVVNELDENLKKSGLNFHKILKF